MLSDESRFYVSNAEADVEFTVVYRNVLHTIVFIVFIVLIVRGVLNHNFRSHSVVLNGTLTARRYVDEILQPV